ncbi:hypothetical protein [Candidatus Harpocratesius sp.]
MINTSNPWNSLFSKEISLSLNNSNSQDTVSDNLKNPNIKSHSVSSSEDASFNLNMIFDNIPEDISLSDSTATNSKSTKQDNLNHHISSSSDLPSFFSSTEIPFPSSTKSVNVKKKTLNSMEKEYFRKKTPKIQKFPKIVNSSKLSQEKKHKKGFSNHLSKQNFNFKQDENFNLEYEYNEPKDDIDREAINPSLKTSKLSDIRWNQMRIPRSNNIYKDLSKKPKPLPYNHSNENSQRNFGGNKALQNMYNRMQSRNQFKNLEHLSQRQQKPEKIDLGFKKLAKQQNITAEHLQNFKSINNSIDNNNNNNNNNNLDDHSYFNNNSSENALKNNSQLHYFSQKYPHSAEKNFSSYLNKDLIKNSRFKNSRFKNQMKKNSIIRNPSTQADIQYKTTNNQYFHIPDIPPMKNKTEDSIRNVFGLKNLAFPENNSFQNRENINKNLHSLSKISSYPDINYASDHVPSPDISSERYNNPASRQFSRFQDYSNAQFSPVSKSSLNPASYIDSHQNDMNQQFLDRKQGMFTRSGNFDNLNSPGGSIYPNGLNYPVNLNYLNIPNYPNGSYNSNRFDHFNHFNHHNIPQSPYKEGYAREFPKNAYPQTSRFGFRSFDNSITNPAESSIYRPNIQVQSQFDYSSQPKKSFEQNNLGIQNPNSQFSGVSQRSFFQPPNLASRIQPLIVERQMIPLNQVYQRHENSNTFRQFNQEELTYPEPISQHQSEDFELRRSFIIETLSEMKSIAPLKIQILEMLNNKESISETELLRQIKKSGQYLGNVALGLMMFHLIEEFGSDMIQRSFSDGKYFYSLTSEFKQIIQHSYLNKEKSE